MEITILKWHPEAKTETDVQTLTFLITTNQLDIPQKIAVINLSGSLMTQLGEYITERYGSDAFYSQLGKLAAALLRKELRANPNFVYYPDISFGYMTDDFPYGALDVPVIDTPTNWSFVI